MQDARRCSAQWHFTIDVDAAGAVPTARPLLQPPPPPQSFKFTQSLSLSLSPPGSSPAPIFFTPWATWPCSPSIPSRTSSCSLLHEESLSPFPSGLFANLLHCMCRAVSCRSVYDLPLVVSYAPVPHVQVLVLCQSFGLLCCAAAAT